MTAFEKSGHRKRAALNPRTENIAQPKTRAYGVLIDHQLVMIPAQTSADGPFAEANHVLNKGGLLQIGPIRHKTETQRSAWIEIDGIGYDIAEIFIQKHGVGFDARLPFLIAVAD